MPDNPTLTLWTEVVGTVRTVRLSGKLTSGAVDLLRAQVRPFIAPAARIVLDLSDVTFMDSTGLGTIASLYVSSKTAGCQLELVNFSRRVRDLFSVTHLLSLFETSGENDARIV